MDRKSHCSDQSVSRSSVAANGDEDDVDWSMAAARARRGQADRPTATLQHRGAPPYVLASERSNRSLRFVRTTTVSSARPHQQQHIAPRALTSIAFPRNRLRMDRPVGGGGGGRRRRGRRRQRASPLPAVVATPPARENSLKNAEKIARDTGERQRQRVEQKERERST